MFYYRVLMGDEAAARALDVEDIWIVEKNCREAGWVAAITGPITGIELNSKGGIDVVVPISGGRWA
jgi:hypothetical protein